MYARLTRLAQRSRKPAISLSKFAQIPNGHRIGTDKRKNCSWRTLIFVPNTDMDEERLMGSGHAFSLLTCF